MKKLKLSKKKLTLIDSDMFNYLNQFKWYASYNSDMKKYYVVRSNINRLGKPSTEYLHHYVIGKPFKGFVVDHIDGDPLNNQIDNLRIVTHRQNLQNKKVNRDGKLCGASYRPEKGKWQAYMRIGKKTKSLGYYVTEKEAHLVYMDATKRNDKTN